MKNIHNRCAKIDEAEGGQMSYSAGETVEGQLAFSAIVLWLYLNDKKFESGAQWKQEFIKMLLKQLKIDND